MRIIKLLPVLLIFSACAQNSAYLGEIQAYQNELNEQFTDPEESPLTKEDLAGFDGLVFFPINDKFKVDASFERITDEAPFEMPTSTDRKPIYQKYGAATFNLNNQNFTLSIYQNLALTETPGYEEYLFLPFTDASNGVSTYGGGRYIELSIPDGYQIVIDFNKAYNPYCAYNSRYSCPIPPKENDLDVEILAGVMAYKEH
jgi:uncharacterized protein